MVTEEPAPGWWRRLWGPGRFTVLVVILLLAAATGYLGARAFALSRQASQLAAERAQALSDASRFAVNLTSYDYRNLNAAFDAVVADATPAFGRQYRATSESRAARLRTDRSVSHGTVVAAGIEDETAGRSADVLVLVNQSITNVDAPTPGTQRGELRMALVRSGDRWLLSDLTLL